MAVSEPQIIEIANGWEFAYIEEHDSWPVIQLRNITKSRGGDVIAELDAFCMHTDTMTPISGIRFNLTSLQTRASIAKNLQGNILLEGSLLSWGRIIPDVCQRVLKLYRNGASVTEIWPSDELLLPKFLIQPILPLNQPSIIFGDGGAGKGHIAQTLSIVAYLPFDNNKLGLIAPEVSSPVLYLDYESDEDEFTRTLSGLCRGFELSVGLNRLQMSQKVSSLIEQLRKKVLELGIRLLVIDSLAPASGGNINEAEPAIELYSSLRTLPDVTTLIIAHTSKDMESKKKSVYGSVFFTNLARSVWEVRKSQEPGDTEMILSLTHRKANRKLELPIGLQYSFDDETNTINVSKVDLATTSLSNQLPLSFQIRGLLRSGPISTQDIAESLSATPNHVRAILSRLNKAGTATKNEGGLWCLQARID